MKKPDKILAAHRSGEVNLHQLTLKGISDKFDCSEATACLARKMAREEDKVEAPRCGWQLVLDAHNEGRVNLLEGTDTGIGKILSVHHSVVCRARRELGIRKGNKADVNPYAWYWYRWKKTYGIFNKWGVIPERVGLTRNEWRKKCELM